MFAWSLLIDKWLILIPDVDNFQLRRTNRKLLQMKNNKSNNNNARTHTHTRAPFVVVITVVELSPETNNNNNKTYILNVELAVSFLYSSLSKQTGRVRFRLWYEFNSCCYLIAFECSVQVLTSSNRSFIPFIYFPIVCHHINFERFSFFFLLLQFTYWWTI